jgi:prepilin-type N-terminal cleavage/methylation domain-containing protein
MRHAIGKYARSQSGFTLVELVIASVIGVMLMTALTSVILTATRSVNTATNRIEASAQIRNFEFFAYDDFAQSVVPLPPSGCGTLGNPPCTTQPIALSGPPPISYTWDGSAFLDRQSGATVIHMATNVTAFAWYVDTSSLHPTVVMSLTVTVPRAGDPLSSSLSYSESQTFRFVPQLNP